MTFERPRRVGKPHALRGFDWKGRIPSVQAAAADSRLPIRALPWILREEDRGVYECRPYLTAEGSVRKRRSAAFAMFVLLTASACGTTVSPAQRVTPGMPRAEASTATPLTARLATPPAKGAPTDTPTPAPSGRGAPTVHEWLVAAGSEPTVAISPGGELAVVVQEIAWPRSCSRPVVRFSRDGGKAWSQSSHPWGRRCEDIHAVIAWGPDDRLWAGDAMGVAGGVRMAVTYSDDFGRTWATPWIEPFTPAWVGCFPAMTVDTDPDSPNFGTLYVAYNWLPSPAGPGLHVLAKPLRRPWAHVEVPVVGLPGYPAHNRIGYRLVATAAGAMVSFYEADLRRFPTEAILSNGPAGNVGRQGFATAAIRFDGTTLAVGTSEWATDVRGVGTLYLEPRWQSQLSVDDSGGGPRLWLAIESGGRIRVGRRGVGGSWAWMTLGAGFKPVLAVSSGPDSGLVFVGWHVMRDGTIRNEWTVSYDHGRTWLPTRLASDATWRFPTAVVGTGLRENATYGDHSFYWAWADTRSGRIMTYMAAVRP
jgi:hypothetical protein